jgi:hypothetical protein
MRQILLTLGLVVLLSMGLVFISNALGFDPKAAAMLCGTFLSLLLIYSLLSYLYSLLSYLFKGDKKAE